MSVLKCFCCEESISETCIKIYGQYLCSGCEEKLLRSQAGKTDYKYWINSCRRFWEEIDTHSGAEKG